MITLFVISVPLHVSSLVLVAPCSFSCLVRCFLRCSVCNVPDLRLPVSCLRKAILDCLFGNLLPLTLRPNLVVSVTGALCLCMVSCNRCLTTPIFPAFCRGTDSLFHVLHSAWAASATSAPSHPSCGSACLLIKVRSIASTRPRCQYSAWHIPCSPLLLHLLLDIGSYQPSCFHRGCWASLPSSLLLSQRGCLAPASIFSRTVFQPSLHVLPPSGHDIRVLSLLVWQAKTFDWEPAPDCGGMHWSCAHTIESKVETQLQ